MNAGDTIAGRYRVEGRLGVGGMSTVLLAVDQRLERHVAVKLLAEHLADDPSFVSRFRREALAAARLVHPNVVQVFDFGFDADAHQHFIVMEHVPGKSCAELLRERGHLDVEAVVEIITQACRGLDYAHRNGVVHRDVKPGNLLVADSRVVKLADFGIARATGQTSITQIGSVLGTAAYLSPEQTRGEEAGPYADLYSLGVVAYQLLSGRLPYEATSLSELALKQQREAPVSLQELNPRVPQALSDGIGLAISIVPADRPADARELAELVSDGARGISPPAAARDAAALADPATAATRVIRRRGAEQPTAETVVARPPAQGRAGAPPARAGHPGPGQRLPAQAQSHGDARRRAAGRRFAALLALLVAVVIVAVVVVVIASSSSAVVVHYHKVIADDAQTAINRIRAIVRHYTTK